MSLILSSKSKIKLLFSPLLGIPLKEIIGFLTIEGGTFVALDLILFFVFFELVLLPMYFMIGIWGDRTVRSVAGLKNEIETRLYASIKFFVFTLFGSAFTIDNIHVENNFIHSTEGAGIMFRDVEEGYIANNKSTFTSFDFSCISSFCSR